MGITARGAWESVKRHFREMDVDIHATPFSVVGVGDMSGDVFGNGMLREDTIRLLAAFDHRDIFIDPDPDPKASLAERQRLFELPRSSWQDYDKSLISAGGGVYSRKAKEIHLSPQAQALFGLAASVTPPELIKAILKAKVDLLWFGGIGTYVRAANETDEAVGDRGNDAIRVTGADLNCKVVGEGANLGMTQRGRVEAAMRGIRLNTDAIDNSAGVNTSDVEVNIKIALSPLLRSGALQVEARNALLAEMTDEVARLVLHNNYQQTLALSLAQRRALEDLGFQLRLMQTLESHGALNRAVEFLPDDMTLAERRKRNQGAHPAGARGAARLCQARALQRAAAIERAGRSLSRARARALFPQGNGGTLRRGAACASAAARDHRHAAHQFDDQPRRRHADRAHHRPDRRFRRGDRGGLRGGAQQLSHGRAQSRDRRARQQACRRRAACALRRGAGPAARPAGLVPAQCRSRPGPGRHHRPLPRRHRAGGGGARRRVVEGGRAPSATRTRRRW